MLTFLGEVLKIEIEGKSRMRNYIQSKGNKKRKKYITKAKMINK